MSAEGMELDISEFFIAGGTLRPDSPSYVKRPADDELFHRALSSEFCYILTARQMGKSSLMIRTARQLQAEGVSTVIIDLTQIGTVSIDQWYLGLLSQLKRRLKLSADPAAWWQVRSALGHVQRFTDFLRDVVLTEVKGQIVIFIDEIDTTLKLDFRDDFFAAIRAIYNARADEPGFERLTFVLLGVASPADLIMDRNRTPFNIGQEIPLRHFSREDAQILRQGLRAAYSNREAVVIFNRIFYWTNGHPYLTQKLCHELVQKKYPRCDEKQVDELVKSLFLSEEARKETNLQFVRENVLAHPQKRQLLSLYEQIYQGKKIRDDKQSVIQNQLRLSGLVIVEDGYLSIHNEIYRHVFNSAWIRSNTAINWTPIAVGIAIFVSVLAVGYVTYNAYIANQTQVTIGNFYRAHSPREQAASLARLFTLRGLFSSIDYESDARDLFYGMPRDQQLALFSSYNDADDSDLLVITQGIYTTLADTDGTDSTGPLLEAMSKALDNDSKVAGDLKKEIGNWLRGRDLAKQGKYAEALDAYNVALALNKQNPATWYEKAGVQIEQKSYDNALASLDQVIAIARQLPAPPTPTPPPTPKPSATSPSTTAAPTITSITATSPSISMTSAPATVTLSGTQPSLPTAETPTPSPTPLPETINPKFATNVQIIKAVKDLIDSNPELISVLIKASASLYTNLRQYGLVPTPIFTPSPPGPTQTFAQSPATPTLTPTPILIKVVSDLPMTGAENGEAQTIVNAVKMAFEEKNYKACNGAWTIQYDAHDDASAALGKWDPGVVMANANAYAADKDIVAVIGTINSGASRLMIPILNPENLVMISPDNTYPGLTKPFDVGEPDKYYPNGKRNYTRVVAPNDIQGAAGAQWAKDLGAKSAYILDDQESYGKGMADVFDKSAKNLGLNVLGHEGIDPKAADYKALATKISGLNPDMVYLGMITQNNAGQLVKDIRGVGFKGIMMGPDGVYTDAFISAAGSASDGFYATFADVPPDAMTGKAATWRDAYQAKYGSAPGSFAVYGYVATQLLLDAFERMCASGHPLTNRAAVRDAVFATRNFDSVLGVFSIDANGDTTLDLISGYQVINGKFQFVAFLGNQ